MGKIFSKQEHTFLVLRNIFLKQVMNYLFWETFSQNKNMIFLVLRNIFLFWRHFLKIKIYFYSYFEKDFLKTRRWFYCFENDFLLLRKIFLKQEHTFLVLRNIFLKQIMILLFWETFSQNKNIIYLTLRNIFLFWWHIPKIWIFS